MFGQVTIWHHFSGHDLDCCHHPAEPIYLLPHLLGVWTEPQEVAGSLCSVMADFSETVGLASLTLSVSEPAQVAPVLAGSSLYGLFLGPCGKYVPT